jgi:hypothetical protein
MAAPQKIILAAGLEIRDSQGASMLQYLGKEAQAGAKDTWTYPKGPVANAKFIIKVVYTMDEFRKALDEAGAWVVYEGHSRYGQGPAFGDARIAHCPPKSQYPVNPWGVHFRMGYDATDSECVGDILEHAVNPTEFDLLSVPKGALLAQGLEDAGARASAAESRRKKGRLSRTERKTPCAVVGAWRDLKTCFAKVAAEKTCRGDTPLDGRHYYKRIPGTTKDEFITAVKVGRADLDASSLKCAVFFMPSCSSKVHYRRALVDRRKAARSKCKFFLTSSVPLANHAVNFLKAAFAGIDPSTRRGSEAFLKIVNGEKQSGRVRLH